MTKLGDPFKLRLDPELENMIESIAVRNNETKADVCRRLLRSAAQQELGKEAVDFILPLIRQAVAETQKPMEERLVAINAKTAIAAATAMYTNVEVLGQLGKRDIRSIHEEARLKAVAYVKSKSEKNDGYRPLA